MATVRQARRAVHGVIVLDKPLGLSSTQALQRVRRLLNAEKAGHAGTLDPLATGVLPLCFGAATKLAQAGLDADKRYLATLQLGATTTTGDLEGTVVRTRSIDGVDRVGLVDAIRSFVGEIAQRPPMHSALKHDGKPLYAYARAGVDVERPERRVRIGAIHVVGDHGNGRWTIDVACAKGTYIRTLVADLGEAIGCGAHLVALRRTAAGPVTIGDAVTLDALEALDLDARDRLLRPADTLVSEWPSIALAPEEAGRFLTGLRRRVARSDTPRVRVYGPDPRAFLGIGRIAGGELIATRLLSPAEVAAGNRAPTLASLAAPRGGAAAASGGRAPLP